MRVQPLSTAVLVTVAVLSGSVTIATAQDSPQDYPQWRGRTRNGAASAFVEPKRWPDRLTLKWKVDVGEGYGTPIVIGNRVYTHTRRDAWCLISEVLLHSAGAASPLHSNAPERVGNPGLFCVAPPSNTPSYAQYSRSSRLASGPRDWIAKHRQRNWGRRSVVGSRG